MPDSDSGDEDPQLVEEKKVSFHVSLSTLPSTFDIAGSGRVITARRQDEADDAFLYS